MPANGSVGPAAIPVREYCSSDGKVQHALLAMRYRSSCTSRRCPENLITFSITKLGVRAVRVPVNGPADDDLRR